MTPYEFTLPLYVYLPRKRVSDKKISLSLNKYRNNHHSVNNEAKKEFKKLVTSQINEIYQMEWPIEITYQVNPSRRCDISNFASICDKYFCDALVESGRLPEDDFRYVKRVIYEMGEVVAEPYCTATVRRYEE